MMKRILISDEKNVVFAAIANNIENIMIDLEREGKQERQGHIDAHFTTHNLKSVKNVRSWLDSTDNQTKLLVRCNPISQNSTEEIESVIDLGAEIIMLPMFRTIEDVKCFKDIVNGRVPVVLLAETRDSILNFEEISQLLSPDDRVHFGLNDLSLEFGFNFLFDVLKSKVLDGVTHFCVQNNIEFGIGGVGSPNSQSIVSPNYILGQHIKLGSSWVILSRAFRNNCVIDGEFNEELFSDAINMLSKLDFDLRKL